MLKYGRNEKITSCVLLVTNDNSCFGASLFHLESPSIKFSRCDFLTNFLTKGIFLTSTTQNATDL